MTDALKIFSINLKTSFGDDAFVVQQVNILETLSEPYVIDVYAFTCTTDFDGDALINQKAAVIFEIYNDKQIARANKRPFHGIITHMEHLKTNTDTKGNVQHYFHIQIHSKFWILKHSRDFRIFQKMSAIDIVEKMFGDYGITDHTIKASGGKGIREYCVQYGETHFDFISRLLEEEGIGYYFTHTDLKHTIVLFDKNVNFEKIPQGSLEFMNQDSSDSFVDTVYAFGKKAQVAPKSYKTTDFNYHTPHTQLLNHSSGKSFGKEVYEYPGLFQKSADGHKLSDIRMQEIEWFEKKVYGRSTCAALAPGFAFTLKNHPIKNYNKDYVISHIRHEITSHIDTKTDQSLDTFDITYKNSFEGFLKTIPYHPQRKTTKPRIYGSQTAFVTGKGTEVYSDSMARIKVKFHWDLRNPDDDTSSLWVRVSQSLSGAAWGALFMPRIGMEVVISFIDGDPDRPLVTGCVYNQAFQPPYSPKSKPHYMTLKSKTFDNPAGFNEFRFSDKPGKEEIFTHAQYDMNTVIEHSRKEDINKGNDTLTIHKGNKKIHQKGSKTTYLTLINNGQRITKLKKGNFVIDVNGTILIKATKDITIKTPKNVNIDAGMNINMKAGMNIKSKGGISIQGKAGSLMKFESGALCNIKAGAVLKAEGGALGVFKGAITKVGN